MEHLLAVLNPDEQRLVKLNLKGYRADEIAEALGLSRDAVYQRMHRAVMKMRTVLVVLLFVAAASGLAIAVVPQWKQTVFQRQAPSEEQEPLREPQTKAPAGGADTSASAAAFDTVVPVPERRLIPLPERLQPMLPSAVDSLPSRLPLPQRISITVSGANIIVTGLRGERVTIRSAYGPVLASQECYGMGVFGLFPYDDFFMKGRRSYEIQIGDTLFFDLTL